ncbi:ribonuclease III [Psychroflexus sp. CAK57W]|uniref:ribonuclease III n=1 Tax=Psychroflexus curvus TaxID=2873595 RepID=UPI001CCEDDE6|nr:ribonuclease III [Psychroflexus curvus]MBZ9627112.1 ribonuclease III [Psychroflexus curvus]MBZ9787118.1 ribonuclease III [Psychroflexus curvus]
MKFLKHILNESRSQRDGIFFQKIQEIVKVKLSSLPIYKQAFTHRSSKIKNEKGLIISYERLEFLGDSILGAVISTYLFENAPYGDEGYLTKMRSKIVSRKNLNMLGQGLNLSSLILSEIPADKLGKNINGNLFEALIGAIYIDKGFKACEVFINKKVIQKDVDLVKLEKRVVSYKSLMIEWCQKNKFPFEFIIEDDMGKDEEKHFSVKLIINDEISGKARETSKKRAEEKASQRAYFTFQNYINP